MPVVRLTLFGPFEARCGPGAVVLPRKAPALLAYQCLAAAPAPSRSTLAVLFGGDANGQEGRNNLRQVLFRLRRALGHASRCIVLDDDTVRLAPGAVETDVARFHAFAADGSDAALRQAGELYRGELLEGLDVGLEAFEDWLRAERERCRDVAIDVLSKLARREHTRGASEAAIAAAHRLLTGASVGSS